MLLLYTYNKTHKYSIFQTEMYTLIICKKYLYLQQEIEDET